MKHPSDCVVRPFTIAAGSLLLVLLASAFPAAAQPCQVPNTGGTVLLPPDGCTGYVSPQDLHLMIDQLDPGTRIEVDANHNEFFNQNRIPDPAVPGGEIETFDSILLLNLTGTGALAGFSKSVGVQVACEVHTGPRTPGDAVQTFSNEMVSLSGIFGDPDFDFLTIQAGSNFGLPSPGQTTLTRLGPPGSNFQVDSFFDITYRIDWQGAPGGALDGFGGSTTATVKMALPPPPPDPCVVVDEGTGTVTLPSGNPNCPYISPQDFHRIVDGVPPGFEIVVASASHDRFLNVVSEPGGNLGGDRETYGSSLNLHLVSEGLGMDRVLTIPVAGEAHTGLRNPGDPIQMFPTDMFRMQGEIFGDPDFDLLRIRAGTDFGLPSPGETTLTQLPSGNWNVDSFFDITYTIEFQGAPGGALGGAAGTTQGTVRMQTGSQTDCGPPDPGGTHVFPSTSEMVLNLGGSPVVVRASGVKTCVGGPFDLQECQNDLDCGTGALCEGDTVVVVGPENNGVMSAVIRRAKLRGRHPATGGDIEVRVGSDYGLSPTLGELRRRHDCAFDSFFDVITEIDMAGLGTGLTTDRALHIEAVLPQLPPQDVKYENPFVDPVVILAPGPGICSGGQQCLTNVDCPVGETCTPGPPQPVGEILYERHHADPPFPPPRDHCFPTVLNAQVFLPDLSPTPFPVSAQGPATIHQGAETDDGTGTRTVQTEMLSMDLSGNSPVGPIQIRQSPFLPSPGQTTNQDPNRTYPASSSMDVQLEIEVQTPLGVQVLHTQQPIQVSGIGSSGEDGITNIPPDPDTNYSSVGSPPVPLFDQGGAQVGDISEVNHIIEPPFDWQPPPPQDHYCFDSWLHLEITIFNPVCQDELWIPGVFRILRNDPIDPAGLGLEIAQAVMAKASFLGTSSCTGPLSVSLQQDQGSLGQVSSLAEAEFFPADSFFDVFAQFDSGIGPLSTTPDAATPPTPVHMTTTINALPPDDGEIYFGPGTVIPIYDAAGNHIGDILEVAHEVHRRIECPLDSLARISARAADASFPEAVQADPGLFNVGIPGGGLGIVYDVVRGNFGVGGGSFGSLGNGLPTAVCAQEDGSNAYTDTAHPPLGQGFFYVSREEAGLGVCAGGSLPGKPCVLGAGGGCPGGGLCLPGGGGFVGSWNSGGANQSGDRDGAIPPPAAGCIP